MFTPPPKTPFCRGIKSNALHRVAFYYNIYVFLIWTSKTHVRNPPRRNHEVDTNVGYAPVGLQSKRDGGTLNFLSMLDPSICCLPKTISHTRRTLKYFEILAYPKNISI